MSSFYLQLTGGAQTLTIGDALSDSNGSIWTLTGFEGWDGPDVVMSTSNPILQGVVIGEHKYGGRPLVISGNVFCTSEALMHEARRTVMAAADLVRTMGTLKVFGETVAKQVSVALSGRVKTRMRGSNFMEFEIPLLAPDPRKYNQTATTFTFTIPGGQHFVNFSIYTSGDAGTGIHWSIAGPADNPRIITDASTGAHSLQYTGTLGTSDVLDIDTATRTVLLNGVNAYGSLDTSSYWRVFNSGSETLDVMYARNTNYANSSIITISFRDAWY